MMVLDEHPHQINFSVSYETELNSVWEQKGNSLLWSKRDTKLDRRDQVRNEKISRIIDQFLSGTKHKRHHYGPNKQGYSKHNYGVSEPYTWKSEYHKQQCFEILQAAGLLKDYQEQQQKSYDYVDGFYHNTTVPKVGIEAKHIPTKQELWIEENRKFSELGGMEVNL
jgi:hypothetical protein